MHGDKTKTLSTIALVVAATGQPQHQQEQPLQSPVRGADIRLSPLERSSVQGVGKRKITLVLVIRRAATGQPQQQQ